MLFYVISDVHGFYDEMLKALDEAGFDPNNENHWLISCGDNFDRGPKPVEVMKYLIKLPRKTLIRGNHTNLFEECCERGYWQPLDVHNGTFRTICDMGGADKFRSFDECCIIAEQRVKPFINNMVNYFETKIYAFCHSWVPNKEDWRTAHQSEWDDAMWANPLNMAMTGREVGKCVVSGHWHCSAGWAMQNGTSEFGDDAIFEPFYYKDKLIMIDACTVHSGKVNVLTLVDELLEEQE